MTFKKIFIYLCICSVAVACMETKHDEGKEKLEAVCDKFMDHFSRGGFHTAYTLLRTNSTIGDSVINDIEEKSPTQMASLKPTYGKILSHTLVANYSAKDVVAKRYYILRFDRSFLKFSFTMYNNGRSWVITGFSYDEDVNDVLSSQ